LSARAPPPVVSHPQNDPGTDAAAQADEGVGGPAPGRTAPRGLRVPRVARIIRGLSNDEGTS
jgi:hypothetical protein